MRVALLVSATLLVAWTFRKIEAQESAEDRPQAPPDPYTSVKQNPATVIDASVKDMYDFGDEITLKWSAEHAEEYKAKFSIVITSVAKSVHSAIVEGDKRPSNDSYEYRLPKLAPGRYDWEIKAGFSKDGDTKSWSLSGTFTIVKMYVTVISPIRQPYDHGDLVELEWSMPSEIAQSTGLEISVWDKKTPDDPTIYPLPCEDRSIDNTCKLQRLPLGVYEWVIQGVSPSGHAVKSDRGSFAITRVLDPKITAPFGKTYEYKEKISIQWSLGEPKWEVKMGRVIVWKTGNKNDQLYYPFDTDNLKSNRYELPLLSPGDYQVKVELVARNLRRRTSANTGHFSVKPDPPQPQVTVNLDNADGNVQAITKNLPNASFDIYYDWGKYCGHTGYFIPQPGNTELEFESSMIAAPAFCFVKSYDYLLDEYSYRDLNNVRLVFSNGDELRVSHIVHSFKFQSEYDDISMERNNGLLKLVHPILVRDDAQSLEYRKNQNWIEKNAKSSLNFVKPIGYGSSSTWNAD